MWKKFLACSLSVTMLLSSAVCFAEGTAAPAEAPAAEEDDILDLTGRAIANGNVAAVNFVDLTAPCSGTLLSFDLEAGDTVNAGDVLFRMQETSIIAPEGGEVTSVMVAPGDSADAAMAIYSSVISVKPAKSQRISCTYQTASSEDENKLVHIGEILYFQSARSGKTEGSGRVIAADTASYTIEVQSGSFDLNESLTIYRDKAYSSDQKVGSGRVFNRPDVTISAAGIVASVSVKAGDKVTAGQTLMTVLAQDAAVGTSPEVKAPVSGVIAAVGVSDCQQVWKGALLARIYLTDELEVIASVDEMDLNGLKVGDALPVTLDTDENTILTGTVTEISGIGVTRQNAAYYTIHVAVQGDGLMIGQSASVYLPKE